MCVDVWPLACRMDHISVMERPMPAEDDAAAAAGGMTMSGVDGRGGVGGAAAVAFACTATDTTLAWHAAIASRNLPSGSAASCIQVHDAEALAKYQLNVRVTILSMLCPQKLHRATSAVVTTTPAFGREQCKR